MIWLLVFSNPLVCYLKIVFWLLTLSQISFFYFYLSLNNIEIMVIMIVMMVMMVMMIILMDGDGQRTHFLPEIQEQES